MRTADDDSVPVPHDAFSFPRGVLNWKTPHAGGGAAGNERGRLDSYRAPSVRLEQDSDDEDDPTRMIQVPIMARPPERPAALQVLLARAHASFDAALARAAELWRQGPLRTATLMAGVALITYLAVGGLRGGGSETKPAVVAPAAALPAVAPIIVEQLAAAPLSKSGGHQTVAPAQSKSKSRRAERSSAPLSNSSAGLPAWGAEAVSEFSGAKTSKSAQDQQARRRIGRAD